MVDPPSDWFWCGRVCALQICQSPLLCPLFTAARVALDLSWRLAPLPAFALVRAPLRRHVDLRSLLRGGVFGLRQPLVQDVGSHSPSRGGISTSCLASPCCGVSCLRLVSLFDASAPKDSISVPSCWQSLPYMPAQ